MIKLEVIGCLGADIEQVNTSGTTFYTFNLAVNRKRGDKEETIWVGCSMNKVSDNLRKYLVKGQMVFVRGEPRFRIFDSAKYHCKMVAVDLFVDDISLLGGSPKKEDAKTDGDDVAPF